MLKIEKTVTMSPEQMLIIIEGMRNPMNSWGRIDSDITHIEDPETLETGDYQFCLGEKDAELMHRLSVGGSTHAKYRRMMNVLVTLSAPLYWWKEFDTYKVGTVANSCSTMHKIAEKEFTIEDFSCEHLGYLDVEKSDENQPYADTTVLGFDGDRYYPLDCLIDICGFLNHNRKKYLETGDKKYWWQMIQLLPSSYNQKRTVQLNYEVLNRIFWDRCNHKLDEWHTFCDWIKTLPYMDIVCPLVQFTDTDEYLKKEENADGRHE